MSTRWGDKSIKFLGFANETRLSCDCARTVFDWLLFSLSLSIAGAGETNCVSESTQRRSSKTLGHQQACTGFTSDKKPLRKIKVEIIMALLESGFTKLQTPTEGEKDLEAPASLIQNLNDAISFNPEEVAARVRKPEHFFRANTSLIAQDRSGSG
ncbi:hypothetical protein Aperf_G00000047516 [Anoplocephala perfoliata]